MQPSRPPAPPDALLAADPVPGEAPPAPALLPPRDLDALRVALAGRYVVVRPLGAGGMATVWLGRDETLDRPVAVKVIAREFTASAVLRGRFLQEARTVARLRHPHIVQVYAAGETEGLLWFAMEFVAGGSLRERLQARGPLPAAEATAILRDLADALAAAHRAGVVHRDIKPENVLVEDDTGRVRLTDFGVARALQGDATDGGRLTRAGMVMGSPRYMSPEQAASDPALDGRSDIYTLGLLGYELLAGIPAFDGVSGANLLVRQLTQPPAPLAPLAPHAPPALVAVIERAIEKDPSARWPDAAAMRDALDAVAHGAAPASPTRSGHTPVGTTPVGTTPVGTTPVGTTPVGTTSVGLTLAGATPGSGAHAMGVAGTLAEAPGAPAVGWPAGRRGAWRRFALPAALAVVLLGAGGYAAARRNGPPPGIDPRRSFAVAPFDVLSPDPQLRWLREGSVNMLTLNLAQWRDVRVADYERTLDALRDLKLDEGDRLGRDDARALARRVGAWTVVTGRVQGTGDSVFVVASLYDVATGRKLDEAQRGAPRAADPRPLFDLVARDLLDLSGAPAITVDLTRTTTGSLAAYRAYLDGERALNSWRLAVADSLFSRAVTEDSTFALAWYKRALGRGWATPGDSTQLAYVAHAQAHADRLAPAQRALLTAYAPLARAFSADAMRGGPAAAAALFDSARVAFAGVVAADSTSTDGWYGLGDAWYHRAATEGTLMGRALGEAGPNAERQETVTQSYAPRLARAYASSRRAFERTIALDSSYHLAYSHLVSIYQMLAAGVTPLVLDGDSLRAVAGPAGVRAYGGQARVDSARARARAMATTAARGWAAADPDSPEAQFGLIGAFLAVGRPDSAVAAVDRALARPTLSSPALAYAAVSAQFAADPARVGRALARALARFPADSIRGRQEPQGTLGIYTQAAAAAAGVGRLADARAILAAGEAAVPAIHATGAEKQATRPILQWYAVALEVAAGLPAGPRIPRIAAGLRTAEAGVQRSAGPMYTPGVLSGLAPIAYTAYLATGDTTFAATVRRLTRATGTPSFPEIDALAALGRGDTAVAAAAIRTFPQPALPTTLGLSGLRAAARGDAMARAGDLRGALAWYAYLDPARFIGVGPYETGIAAYAGTLLTRGALYERLGDRGRAAEAYTRFLALRRDADSSFAAQVAAARAGLARVRDASGTSVPVSGAPAGR